MEKTIFYMHELLRENAIETPFNWHQDLALASLWIGMNSEKKGNRTHTDVSRVRVKKGVDLLKATKNIQRYVFLMGPEKETMLTFVKAQSPKDVFEITHLPWAIRLGMDESLKPSDRMSYLSELNGAVINLHRRGLIVHENKKRHRIYSEETLDLYKCLSEIPTLTHEDYVRIKLLEGLKDETVKALYPYLNSHLLETVIKTIEETYEMDENAHLDIFKKLIKNMPIERIHHLPFKVARLLAA